VKLFLDSVLDDLKGFQQLVDKKDGIIALGQYNIGRLRDEVEAIRTSLNAEKQVSYAIPNYCEI